MKNLIIFILFCVAMAWGADKPEPSKKDLQAQVQKLTEERDEAQRNEAAWKAQALMGLAQAQLDASPQFKELQRRQADLQAIYNQRQADCGEKKVLQWDANGIMCVLKPEPPKPEPAKETP